MCASEKYAMHKYLLYFTDPDIEQRYFDFQYVDNDFIPGKVFALMWVGVAFTSFVLMTDPLHNNASYTKESFTSEWWAGIYISGILNSILWVGLFISSLRKYREAIHLVHILVGWPTLILLFLVTKRPHAFSYTQTLGCSYFSMMIVQCRVCRCFLVVTLWPILCLFVVTFSVPDYWRDHTKIEMLYWLVFILPVFLLSFLEKRTRRSFVERELALEAIDESEHKTAVTQRMIANFFPATPTRDLLHQVNGPRDKSYPNTVLIVTDVKGFTEYTSRSFPADVIAIVTNMFQAFDATAECYGVEKIATVGDSYCGAVFPNDIQRSSDRCASALHFSCAALGFAGSGLELRVGVHIGDVVGVFVGCAPPKFDVFGPGIDHARQLEETGQPSFVHISHAVAADVGVTREGGYETTHYGFLSRDTPSAIVGNEGGVVASVRDVDSVLDADTADPASTSAIVKEASDESAEVTTTPPPIDASAVVSILCRMSGYGMEEDEYSQSDEEVVDKKASGASDEFHILLLTFDNKKLEKKYQAHVRTSDINLGCGRLFLGITFVLFVVQLNLQGHESQDLAIASAIAVILAGMSGYLQYIGTNHRYHLAATFISYTTISVLAFLGLTVNPTLFKLHERYVGDIAGCYAGMAIFASQYCLDTRLVYRCLLTLASALIVLLCMIVRRNMYRDEVAPIDPLPLCGLVFATMSFFPDYSLRSSFRSDMHLKKLQAAAKSRTGRMAASAMSIMLPVFVMDKILSLSREARKRDAEQAMSHLEVTSSNSVSSSEITEVDFNAVTATWEYSHAVVMFAKFHSDDASFTPEAVNMTVQAIEDIATRFGVMKVKTMGSTVMLVCGIDDPRTRQEHMTNMVDTAIMIRSTVFQAMSVDGLEHRMGIHCGSCFGAVIGGNGAIFDLFGDTINTGSRMMSTAEDKSIQLSPAAKALLVDRFQACVALRSGVAIKGKGMMDLFTITGEGAEMISELPRFTSHVTPWGEGSVRSPPGTTSAIDLWRISWARRQSCSDVVEGEDNPASHVRIRGESPNLTNHGHDQDSTADRKPSLKNRPSHPLRPRRKSTTNGY